jgi:DNA-binding transcriptional LysR family regulator
VEFLALIRQYRFMIDLRRLRALRELSDRGTIAAAADALHLTPSAVSQQLAALEREVGQRLVEPDGRGVRLTAAAYVLLDHAATLFAQVERLHADLDAHASGDAGTVRVAGFPTALAEIVAPAARLLAASAPQVGLIVSEAEAPDAYDLLSGGMVDVAIGMESDRAPRRGDPRYARVELVRDVMDVALPVAHPLAALDRVPLHELAADVWITPPSGWQCESVTFGACRTAGFSPNAVHRTSDWMAALRLVEAGLGVALIPRIALAAPPDGVVLRPVAGEPPCRHIFAACRAGNDAAPIMRQVLGALADAARGAAGARAELAAA